MSAGFFWLFAVAVLTPVLDQAIRRAYGVFALVLPSSPNEQGLWIGRDWALCVNGSVSPTGSKSLYACTNLLAQFNRGRRIRASEKQDNAQAKWRNLLGWANDTP